MPSELEQSVRHFRRQRAQREASTARALQNAFERARDGLQQQLDGMVTWQEANPNPPLWRLLAEARTRNLLMQAEALFNQYSREVGDTIHREQAVAVAQAQSDARALIEKGFGTPPVGVGLPFVALPQQAIGQLVATLQPGAPVRRLLDEFGPDAAAAVERELIVGVASGRSPRQTARAISDAIGGHESRALTIARTETLRAYRGSTLEVYKQNTKLLRGWQWHCARSVRTCPVCLALDGQVFAVDEPFRSHVNCRCSAIPLVRGSTVDMGQTASEWFDEQPAELQRNTLGPMAYEAFQKGEVQLTDFVSLSRSRTWGSSYVRGSLDGAKARAEQRNKRAA